MDPCFTLYARSMSVSNCNEKMNNAPEPLCPLSRLRTVNLSVSKTTGGAHPQVDAAAGPERHRRLVQEGGQRAVELVVGQVEDLLQDRACAEVHGCLQCKQTLVSQPP